MAFHTKIEHSSTGRHDFGMLPQFRQPPVQAAPSSYLLQNANHLYKPGQYNNNTLTNELKLCSTSPKHTNTPSLLNLSQVAPKLPSCWPCVCLKLAMCLPQVGHVFASSWPSVVLKLVLSYPQVVLTVALVYANVVHYRWGPNTKRPDQFAQVHSIQSCPVHQRRHARKYFWQKVKYLNFYNGTRCPITNIETTHKCNTDAHQCARMHIKYSHMHTWTILWMPQNLCKPAVIFIFNRLIN